MTEPVSSPVQVPTFALGDGAATYRSVVDDARDAEWAVRLFDRDTSLWTDDPPARGYGPADHRPNGRTTLSCCTRDIQRVAAFGFATPICATG